MSFEQGVGVVTSNQAPFATLSSGDQGTVTLGASGTRATVRVADSAILVGDDVLDITSTDSSWQVRAEYVSHKGFTGLTTTVTLSLRDGLVSATQIHIASGIVTQKLGSAVGLSTTQDTELVVATTLLASGTLTLDLVISKDGGGPVLRYPVTVTVT